MTMWNLFKKVKPEVLVRKFILQYNLDHWFISTDCDLTINEKRDKLYKIYTEYSGYIYYKFGQKYLDDFNEECYKRGWLNKEIHEEIENYENKNRI